MNSGTRLPKNWLCFLLFSLFSLTGMLDTRAADPGTITGKVTGPNGTTGLANIEVRGYLWDEDEDEWGDEGTQVLTNASGNYTLQLSPGEYIIGFRDPAGNFTEEFHDDEWSFWNARSFDVASGQTVTGKDASLATAARISGTVTASGGAPVAGVVVHSYSWDDGEEYWVRGPSTLTASNGTYNLGGLIPGSHRIQFEHPDGAYFSSFHGGSIHVDEATSVSASAGATVTGINGSLSPAGRIAGTVTGGGGLPLANVQVIVYQWNPAWQEWVDVSDSDTRADGTYTVGWLNSGIHRLEFIHKPGNYQTEYYNDVANIDSATDVAVTLGGVATGINASLAELGKVSGTVTGPNGVTPLGGIRVGAYFKESPDEDWYEYRSVLTDANGTYVLTGLPAGAVRLRFRDPSGVHFTEFHNNVASVGLAQDINISNGGTVTGINASLARSGTISGTVTAPDGITPLRDLYVEVYRWDPVWLEWEWIADAEPLNGSYVVGGLTTGNYRVKFDDYSGDYLDEYYNDALNLDAATDVAVTTGSDTGGISASLLERGKISGKVTGPDGLTPLEGIRVTFYRLYDDDDDWWEEDYVMTEPDGTYLLTGLPTGVTRLSFEDRSGIYLTEFHDNAATVETGNDINVIPGATVTGINASLARAGSISGQVTGPDGTTPLGDVEVEVYAWNPGWDDWQWKASGDAVNGNYTVGGLATGSYRVRFRAWDGIHAAECYDNAADLDSATSVSVTLGEDTGGINASLATLGRISGKVTGPDGVTPLPDVEVEAYLYDEYDEYWYSTDEPTYTAVDGTYLISGLPDGAVRIRFRDTQQVHVQEFHQDAATVEAATDIMVSTGVTVTGINASLATAGSISGKVTGPDGTTPLADVGVTVYQWDSYWDSWEWAGASSTKPDGTYLVRGLQSGQSRVRFDDNFRGHLTEYYNNAADLQSATDVAVAVGSVTGGINASLQLGGIIRGTVTGISATPLEDAYVELYRWNAGNGSWERIRTTWANENGKYGFASLVPGTYRVGFTDDYDFHVPEFYNNSATLESATDIVIGAGTSVTGIDVSLEAKGRIAGTVTAQVGNAPLPEIQVTAYQYNPSEDYWDFVSSAFSRTNGTYTVNGLSPGAVKLRFSDSDGNYITEFYNNVSSLSAAQEIIAANGTFLTGIDASLESAGSVSGKVTGPDGITPLEDVEVEIYSWDAEYEEWNWEDYSYTREDGTYRLGRLQSGTYRIGFLDGGSGIHATEYYNDATTVESATDIVVTLGGEVTNINASLDLKNRITGKVTGPDGVSPLRDAQVRVYQYDAGDDWWYSIETVYTRPDGSYALMGLSPGPYRIRFQDQNGNFTEYYNDSPDINGAQDVMAPVTGELANINASLGMAEPVAPAVVGFRKAGTGGWDLEFSGIPGSLYQLQDSTDLKTWRDVGEPVPGAARINSIPLSTDGPKRFWRIRTTP
ncbi:MAG: hypothetical protein EOP85_00255 [Verrucomicrobiaceae bacterium]|nr:MAG: hypothetical protein EOP85_00255 [Verrucomicrobiaceae bacterium]